MKNLKLLFLGAVLGIGSFAGAQTTYSLPKLKFEYNALEPFIDAQTMEIHYTKHHQGYVNNLNKAVAGTKLENLSLNDLMLYASRRPDAVRNNAGGHYNHSLFWDILTPTKGTQPSTELAAAINSTFTSLDSLKKLLNQAASTRFGSGWAWLVLTPEKQLVVTSTPNQDNPIMDVSAVRGIPVLGIDVWEHAYYLKYQNKRGDYLAAIWNVIDWEAVSRHYTEALADPLLKEIARDSWNELKDFHMVMSQTFHPAEENNFTPVKTRSNELVEKAKALKSGKIPSQFNTPEINAAIDELVKGTEELNKLIGNKKTKDTAIMEKLTSIHESFHKIQGLCAE